MNCTEMGSKDHVRRSHMGQLLKYRFLGPILDSLNCISW